MFWYQYDPSPLWRKRQGRVSDILRVRKWGLAPAVPCYQPQCLKIWLVEILTMSVFHPNFLIHCDVNRNFLIERFSGASLCQIYVKISLVRLKFKLISKWRHPYLSEIKETDMLFGVTLSDLLKAWLALLMETRLMTPASLFLLEAPLPPPPRPTSGLWCNVVTPFPIGRYAQHEERSQDVL